MSDDVQREQRPHHSQDSSHASNLHAAARGGRPMTRQQQDSLKRIGAILGIIIGTATLTAMVKAGAEEWLVSRQEFQRFVYRRDSSLAVWLIQDSVAKAGIREELRVIKLYQRSRR